MAPRRKYQGEGCRLRPGEKEFAEKNHGLIYKFLWQKGFDQEEYYDIAAEGYLIAVIKFHRQEQLRKYRFSTIAYKSMNTVIRNELEGRRRYQSHIAISLDACMENGDSYGDCLPDQQEAFSRIWEQEEMKNLLGTIMAGLTGNQREILVMRLEGFNMKEIMKRKKRSFVDYFRDEAMVREKVGSALGLSGTVFARNQGCTGATFPCCDVATETAGGTKGKRMLC